MASGSAAVAGVPMTPMANPPADAAEGADDRHSLLLDEGQGPQPSATRVTSKWDVREQTGPFQSKESR